MPFNHRMAGILEADCYSFMKAARRGGGEPDYRGASGLYARGKLFAKLATFGATTYWQYGWPPLFTKYSW